MKNWFPKKRFTWKEPKTFVRLQADFEKGQESRWARPFGVLVVAALLMLQWWLATVIPSPHRHPPPVWVALLLALGLGFFICYAQPWLMILVEPTINVFENAVIRCWGNTHSRWKLADLTGFSWGVRADFAVLVLHRKTGRTVFVGLPLNISRSELSEFFRERKITELVELPFSNSSQ